MLVGDLNNMRRLVLVSSLATLGFSVTRARVGRLVDLEVDTDDPHIAREEVERMCAELLANPLIESFEVVVEDT